ncbi:putative phage tail collar domain family protein, partial [Candidatus Termititenax persephonae]
MAGGIVMANANKYTKYVDGTNSAEDTDFINGIYENENGEEVAYDIAFDRKISAEGVRNALHTKEKVENKQIYDDTDDTDNTLNGDSLNDYYPSSKLVGENLATIRADLATEVDDRVAADNTINAKLSGIEENANNYTHPTATAYNDSKLYKVKVNSLGHVTEAVAATKADITALGIPGSDTTYTHPTATAYNDSKLYKVKVNNLGHVTEAVAATKADITALGIPGSDTTYSAATGDAAGLMSAADKTNLDGIDTALSGKQASLPVGTILMYDGTGWIDNVTLVGWYKCDGQKVGSVTLPDLRDKFIKGTGSETQPGANWLQLTKENLPSHAHDGNTNSDGSHGHDFRVIHVGGDSDNGRGDYLAGVAGQGQYVGSGNGDGRVCYASFSVMHDDSGHSHSITTNPVGNSAEFNNMPAYYAVIYIKRI